jgi:hypothetical protein
VTKLLTVSSLVALALSFDATPALADPATPTNYRSEVVETDPAASGAVFTVVGGDAFLQVSVTPGHSAQIPGYFSEPYVRIDPGGKVWVNVASPAYYINQERYGQVSIPDDATPQSPPSWELVAEDGTYAWHDHRSHWMSDDLPPTVAGDGEVTVFPWQVPAIVDGIDTTVRGELVWVPSKNPAVPILAGLIALLPLALLGIRSLGARALLITAGSTTAAAVTWLQNGATPASARGFSGAVLLPVGALAYLIVVIVNNVSSPRVANMAGLIAGVLLAAWAVGAISTLWMPVLPSMLSPVVERSAVAFVVWAAAAISASQAFLMVKPVSS